jgi:glycosyltransferase involved in cell wall biosynthesis
MPTLLLILAIAILTASIIILADMLIGFKKIKNLTEIDFSKNIIYPFISIVIPACNEEKKIEKSLESVLNLEYDNYEVILVNDRSIDNTNKVLLNLQNLYKRLKILNVAELPPDWLGKNHALHLGASHARGEMLLFADADVVMRRSTLKRAVTYFLDNELDHLAISPKAVMPGFFLPMFTVLFSIYFSIYGRPWRARYSKSKYHIGIGAFNLLRKSTYDNLGGHTSIRMRPDDDMKLGKVIKSAGYKQDMLFGFDMLTVEWYSTTKQLVEGLLKNSYAAINYNIFIAIFTITGQFLFSIWPFIAVFVTDGATQIIYLIVIHICFILFVKNLSITNAKIWQCGAYPFLASFFIYIQIRAIIKILMHKGIIWRGTFYELDNLKKNKV